MWLKSIVTLTLANRKFYNHEILKYVFKMIRLYSNETVLLIILSLFLIACEKEKDTVNVVLKNEGRAKISFSPAEAKWFKRIPPDSVLIDISGGFPPYIILDRPLIHVAKIDGEQLIIFPRRVNINDEAKDFINIQDNNGNVNTLNMLPETLFNSYAKVNTLSIDVTGDTNIIRNAMQLTQNAEWDPVEKFVKFIAKQDSLAIEFQQFGIDTTGTITSSLQNFYFGADYGINGLGSDYINPFRLNSVQQSINITELSESALKGSFTIDVTSYFSSNNPEHNVSITCDFSFSK